jgi:hypothetical protein
VTTNHEDYGLLLTSDQRRFLSSPPRPTWAFVDALNGVPHLVLADDLVFYFEPLPRFAFTAPFGFAVDGVARDDDSVLIPCDLHEVTNDEGISGKTQGGVDCTLRVVPLPPLDWRKAIVDAEEEPRGAFGIGLQALQRGVELLGHDCAMASLALTEDPKSPLVLCGPEYEAGGRVMVARAELDKDDRDHAEDGVFATRIGFAVRPNLKVAPKAGKAQAQAEHDGANEALGTALDEARARVRYLEGILSAVRSSLIDQSALVLEVADVVREGRG